eukprot:gene15930-biopygen13573
MRHILIVGIGSGNPEHVTVQAINALNRADVLFVPTKGVAKGAQPSDRVARFLDAAGVAKREARNNPEKAVPRKERKAAAEAAAKK